MNDIRLSKTMSRALRHAPWDYALELDAEGWVDVEQLLSSLKKDMKWRSLTEKDIQRVVENCDKKRYEIIDRRIRALYGHSIPEKIEKEASEPPEILYHGTTRHFVKPIMTNGLLPKGRQYVHLSVDVDTAVQVGSRRDDKPVLLKIHARKAYAEGVKFYKGNEKVWLADGVGSNFIEPA